MCKSLFFLMFLIFQLSAQNIISVSGTILNNTTVMIFGSGFGTKPTSSPVLWDQVDNVPSYVGLSDGATIPVGGSNPWPSPYGNSSGNNYVKYNTSDAQRGVSTAQYKVTNQKFGYLDGLTWQATNYTYISWWWRTTSNVSGETHSSKFLRMSDATDEVYKTFSWTQLQAYVYNDPNYCSNVWNSWNGNPNNWNFLEVWFDRGGNSWTIRINGRTHLSTSWGCTSGFYMNECWKLGFDGGGVSPPAITWWMDDIYIDNSFARVMIGDNSNYSNCTHLEMQIPEEWSNTEIKINFNQGSFSNNASVYLYVIDSNGRVNNSGFPINIGQSSDMPRKPSGIVVSP